MWIEAAMAAYGAYQKRGSVAGGGGEYANPSTATAGAYGSGIDGSNWLVNFSGTQNATASNVKQDQQQPQTPVPSWNLGDTGPMTDAQRPALAGVSPVLLLALIVGVGLWRKSKR